ncbi:MAG: hypothetical protein JKY54_16525 [Flavobacteriales bacterium]|nr:hypothetical protein [Flavobacteriales bacterium]
MKKLLYVGAMFAMVSCGGGEDIAASLQDQVGKAMEEHAAETATTDAVETEEPSSGTWKAWADSYDSGLNGSSVTLEGIVEKVTSYESTDGSKSIMAQFGVEGMMKCAVTAYFSVDLKDALNASRKDKAMISFTGTVEDKSAFDGVQIKDCSINQ